jgi:hypothetical protein
MPDKHRLNFDHEATLEELAGLGKNRRFDEVIDDEEFEDIQVICKRGDEEIPLAKPSRAFYFGDRNLYDQEAKRFDQEEKSRILNTDQFRSNLQVFEELKRACQRGFVIPFVGAGMSQNIQCQVLQSHIVAVKRKDRGTALLRVPTLPRLGLGRMIRPMRAHTDARRGSF